MTWFNNLKLTTKFTLILATVLIVLFSITAYVTYYNQRQLVTRMALEQSRGIVQQIIETRDYMSEVVKDEPENNYALVPQVVATQVAKRISDNKHYQVRQVSLRYRNPANLPDSYETQQLKKVPQTEISESYQVTPSDTGEVFRYMQTMKAERSCLACHGNYDDAPTFVQHRYPRGHFSYNYQVGEILGAVSVVKPLSALYEEIGTNFIADLLYRVFILLTLFLVLTLLIRRLLIAPIQLASTTIKRVTTTGNLHERIPQPKTDDEIGQLARGFNEMMEELDSTTLQRCESEERYRSLIEAAQSAIITILSDGKIVISNQLTETLLGRTRNQLLGESFFTFIDNEQIIIDKINQYLMNKHWGEQDQASQHQIYAVSGNQHVNITIVVASQSAQSPMFTLIIRNTTI